MSEEQTPIGFHEDGSFRFHVPFDLAKGEDGKTWIQGVASVEKEDITGETVILAGMDVSYLLKRGFFNDNHGKTTDAKVGVPTEAKVTPDGLLVRGYLFDTPRAQGIVDLAASLEKAGGDRRLGFSVEGKTLSRDGKIVKSCWIKDIAITAEPTNPYTYLDVVKGISASIKANGYVEEEVESIEPCEGAETVSYWDKMKTVISKCLGEMFKGPILGETVEKALEAGYQNPPASVGSALRVESIDKDLVELDIPKTEIEGLTMDQAVDLLKNRGYSEAAARKVAGMILSKSFSEFMKKAGKL